MSWRSRAFVLGLSLACLTATAATGPAPAWLAPKLAAKSDRGAMPALRHPVAVFGEDERGPLPARLRPVQEKMGLLFNRRSRTVCTAFCVARDTIATAGHCLYRTAGERPPQLADFWFARNFDAVRDHARIAGHGTGGAAQHVVSGSSRLSIRPPIDASKDWALVRLARPVCARGFLPVRAMGGDDIIAAAREGRVFQISYHYDYTPWKLAYSHACAVRKSFDTADWSIIAQDFSDTGALLLHTCDTGGASSGSPLLIETPTGPEVIGINVGTYEQSKVFMQNGKVTKRLKADNVANTAVSATAFAARLDAFREAAILASPAQLRELQQLLTERQLFAGPVDGTYGAALRAAIEAYETAQGLPVTGLATQALLKRLGGGAIKFPRAKS